jgi:hypothetical protein
MTWLLRPGTGLARREPGWLQLGVDPPLTAVLPDSPAVRLLLLELAHGAPLTTLDPVTAPVLDSLVASGLVVSEDRDAVRRDRLAACAVHVDAPVEVAAGLVRLLGAAGLGVTDDAAAASAAVTWTEGEPARDRLDGWMRSGTPHLVVREEPAGIVLGPYVVPGRTACLRCVDAHLGERDPRRALVVEQLATTPPLRPAKADPVQRALATGWVVHELATAADGGAPATWSATVALAVLPPVVTAYRRHLHCGCSWADELLERAG